MPPVSYHPCCKVEALHTGSERRLTYFVIGVDVDSAIWAMVENCIGIVSGKIPFSSSNPNFSSPSFKS